MAQAPGQQMQADRWADRQVGTVPMSMSTSENQREIIPSLRPAWATNEILPQNRTKQLFTEYRARK